MNLLFGRQKIFLSLFPAEKKNKNKKIMQYWVKKKPLNDTFFYENSLLCFALVLLEWELVGAWAKNGSFCGFVGKKFG